ncbi:MAG: hypothetical protein AAB225_28070 [Acidobacteriota bacterium]
MPDRFYLSVWIRGFDERGMLGRFEQLLRAFPFSRLRPAIARLKVYAIEEVEPPLLEQAYGGVPDVEAVLEAARDFEHADCAYMVEGWWDLWSCAGEWKLLPSRVTLACYGPEFANDEGDHLRIELGVDTQFVPQPGLPQAARMAQSNLQSVVRLAGELEKCMPVRTRRLWLESGADFAAQVGAALAGWSVT